MVTILWPSMQQVELDPPSIEELFMKMDEEKDEPQPPPTVAVLGAHDCWANVKVERAVLIEDKDGDVRYSYEYDIKFEEQVVTLPILRTRIIVTRWPLHPTYHQMDDMKVMLKDYDLFYRVIDSVRIKYAMVERHGCAVKDRIKNDMNAIKMVLGELSKMPLGTTHKFMAEHIASCNKAETVTGMEDIVNALEQATTDGTFVECKMLMATNEAEKAHRTYIRNGLLASAGTGQSPHRSDVYKALKIVSHHKHEIEKWQGIFYKKMEELRTEVTTNEIRAQEKLNFRGWE